jgi:hypothetical protein
MGHACRLLRKRGSGSIAACRWRKDLHAGVPIFGKAKRLFTGKVVSTPSATMGSIAARSADSNHIGGGKFRTFCDPAQCAHSAPRWKVVAKPTQDRASASWPRVEDAALPHLSHQHRLVKTSTLLWIGIAVASTVMFFRPGRRV